MSHTEPVQLQEDEATGSHFLIYGDDTGAQVELAFEGERLWLSQAQIAVLFDRDISNISRHIAAIIEEGELDEATSLRKSQTTLGRPATLYSLDMVISVGYRVSSKQATLFRRWATDKLVQFATKGFVIDTVRLKNPGNRDRIAELRDIIRDIRSDEANIYRELRQICAMCQDYDGQSDEWQTFYRNTQAKIVYAVCSKTPAEVLQSRADARQPDMGLTSWPNANIRKSDVAVSKNYLANAEVRELNRLTTILLDIFEDQIDIGRLKLMREADILLDAQLANLGRVVLRHGGSVAMTDAKIHAEREYAKFKVAQKALRQAQADEAIAAIKAAQKTVQRREK